MDVTPHASLVIIPPGFAISGTIGLSVDRSEPLVAISFQVPELLHATRLIIRPGIEVGTHQPEELTFDLTRAVVLEHLSPPSSALEKFPATFTLDEKVTATLDASIPGEVSNGYYLLKTSATLHNSDITDNATFALEEFVVDEGHVYRPTHCDPGLPESIGPGQTVTATVCFALATTAAFGPRPFYVGLLNESLDMVLTTLRPQLTECVSQSPLPDNVYYGWSFAVVRDTLVTLPATISATLQGNNEDSRPAHRWRFEGHNGQTIRMDMRATGEVMWVTDPW